MEIDSIKNVENDVIPWSVEQETGKFDQRSSDDESQVAIDMKMTDISICRLVVNKLVQNKSPLLG